MDTPLAVLLRRGLRLALLYSAATLIFLGALGGAITIALGGNGNKPVPATTEKPTDVKPSTTTTAAPTAPPPPANAARPSTGKTEI